MKIANTLPQLIERFRQLQRGKDTMPLFMIYLMPHERTVHALKDQSASGFPANHPRVDMQQAGELSGKTVAR